jgi:exonuclease SbcC
VLLTERVGDRWTGRATRLDEAGHLVSELLGLTMSQFCQVQMLPQGRFQAFLRADSDERHRLLQRLFRTSRFEDVEQWLRDRRRTLRRDADRAHDTVAALVGRVSEAADRPVPDGWDPHDLRGVADAIGPWAADVAAAASAARETAAGAVTAGVEAETAAREALAHGRTVAERQERRARADARAAALAAGQGAHDARVAVLEAAGRAEAVLPWWDEAARAGRAAREADVEAGRAMQTARDALGRAAEGDQLDEAARDAAAAAARARAREPHVAELAGLDTAIAESEARRAQARQRLEALDVRSTELPALVSRARDAEAAATAARDRLPAVREEAARARERLDAARAVARLETDLAEAEVLHRASIDTAQELREQWLHVQEQRLEGMAAEIAGALAVGASCPVCGSADHPHPARAAAGAPDLAAERAARRSVDDAEAERHARSLAVHDLNTRLEVARERAGHRTAPALETEHTAATSELARSEGRAATLPDARRAREALEAELAGLVEGRSALVADLATLEARRDELGERAERLTAELRDLLAGTGHDTVTGLADHLDSVAAACRDALAADAARESACSLATAAAERAGAAAAARGFADETATRRVALPSLLLESVKREVRDHEAAVAAVTDALADPDLAAAATADAPDLDVLAERHAHAHDALAAARAAESVAELREARLARLGADLDTAVRAWEPVRVGLEVAERMASLADGTSSDNRLRMRLSAYVLASRLSHVVDAANERLARMFDHRYALEHTGARGVGESRGGLSLRVRDDWTGESRDPATLSGGETFVVSLALALGLADVIAHEAGGSELDTLFVDEGFGSLDAETLDQVLDTLDSLRDGGRVVGVVSHVAEMRDRIPTQLRVSKRRVGSTLSQAG